MEIRNLKAFLKVASIQNFTQAAKELGYSQSNISAQIAQLEQEIGAPLFNRIGRQVSLTQFGEELLPYAQDICSTAVKLENLMKSENSLGGTIRIGLTDSIADLIREDAFLAYHNRFPRVQAEISLDTAEMLLERLRRGELDAACVITEPLISLEWNIQSEYLTPIVAVSNPALPITEKQSVTLKELSGQKLVLMERNAPYSIQFERELAIRHLECKPVFRLQSTAASLRMVEKGEFVAVLPYYAVQEAEKRGKAAVLNVQEWRHTQAIQTVLHRSKMITPQITGFLEEIHRSLDRRLSRSGQ
ncbi:MAG: LysR family transcriptional regulator [Oscillospiraceae bacterium]|nr:LysR family transcriptional regulator [Oscillospiraceae bacterium]